MAHDLTNWNQQDLEFFFLFFGSIHLFNWNHCQMQPSYHKGLCDTHQLLAHQINQEKFWLHHCQKCSMHVLYIHICIMHNFKSNCNQQLFSNVSQHSSSNTKFTNVFCLLFSQYWLLENKTVVNLKNKEWLSTFYGSTAAKNNPFTAHQRYVTLQWCVTLHTCTCFQHDPG